MFHFYRCHSCNITFPNEIAWSEHGETSTHILNSLQGLFDLEKNLLSQLQRVRDSIGLEELKLREVMTKEKSIAKNAA